MKQIAEDSLEAISQLRAILLKEDRTQLELLRRDFDDREELSRRVQPIIQEQIAFFKTEFPIEFRMVIDEIIDARIKDSQEEILNVMYPVFGRMIKKFIQLKFEELQESIQTQIHKTQSSIFPWQRQTQSKREADELIATLGTFCIHESYVIQKNSGILLGSLSEKELMKSDALAGMLTAIKLFVEDAFQQHAQNLETIRYENYQIFVYNAYTYYIAVVLEGSLSAQEASNLEDTLTLVSEALNPLLKKISPSINYEVKQVLTSYLDQPSKIPNR